MNIKLIQIFSAAIGALILSACATPPSATYDTADMMAIKTIAVAMPKPTSYFAVSLSGPIFVPIPGASLAISAFSGALAGTLGRAATRANDEFNELVQQKLGDTGLNRKFVDALEAVLREQGYAVKEVELGRDGAPVLTWDKKNGPLLTGGPYLGADALLIAPVQTGYLSKQLGHPYLRFAKTEVRIFKADTLKSIFADDLTHKTESAFQQGGIPYSYNWYSAVKDDLPHAIQGVNEALMNLVPQFKADLLASRGEASLAGAAGVKNTN
ncbi:hypothetical protein WS87_00915 (plasmid) [Burkholderia sp. MSMB0856]|uniref:hypothetical protein n=1 Tax=Burkholderia sp. MSMB0856 TaxID=1637869 RepID=UPI000858708D|nr:hypothetical protein [Burkholderia sp. MSMB0856]AOJ85326.1 hypothetical protein WS87_00915 [Burkholderia sp. MSMB0856]